MEREKKGRRDIGKQKRIRRKMRERLRRGREELFKGVMEVKKDNEARRERRRSEKKGRNVKEE